MPVYQSVGNVPKKRHVVFRQKDGSLFHEELFGTEGFSGTSSLVYHLNPPTMVKEMGTPYSVRPEIVIEDNLRAMSFQSFDVAPESDYIKSRKILFVNDDMAIGIAAPSKSMTDYFYKNSDSDELIFVHKGSGSMHSMYGVVDFEYGDYLSNEV